MFLLDTNVISEMRKRKPHGGLWAWCTLIPKTLYFIPSLALYEMQAGAEITRAQDVQSAQEIDRWITAIRRTYKVIEFDAEAAREAGRLMHHQDPNLTEDAMIAAIAITRGLVVATRNAKDFAKLNVTYVNPFDYKKG